MDMDLEFSTEDIEKIILVSFHYYYNSSKFPTEFNILSAQLKDRIINEVPNTSMERGIITGMSYFLDQEFMVSVNNQFAANPVPNMPANWRNNIIIHEMGSYARYFIRKRNQTFLLRFSYDSFIRKVSVFVNHTVVNHKPYTVDLREAELLGLSNPEHVIAFALHFVDMFTREFKPLVTKAVQDMPPTAQRTPRIAA